MTHPRGNPIERHPKDTLPAFWHQRHNKGIPYRPKDHPKQEDWGSVARKFDVDVDELIYFNFMTNNPDEVNWYLHHYVGCKKVSPSGNNWMFSNAAYPGYIYIPPPRDVLIHIDPLESCQWMPYMAKQFMLRLYFIALVIPGDRGQRIKKLVRVIMKAGYPAALDLWYYNTMNVTTYTDMKTTAATLDKMTKACKEIIPFDGESTLYKQSGTLEQNRGMWRIHAVKDLFDTFACGPADADDIKDELISIDEDMNKGWTEMRLAVNVKSGMGGGGAYDRRVDQFIHHVELLTKSDTSLYAAFGP